MVYCRACQLGQLAPLPSEQTLAELYGAREYYEGTDQVGYAEYLANASHFRRTFGTKLRWLLQSGPVETLGEIGCGPGYLLEAARDLGIRSAVGVDRNPWAVEQACRQGLDVRLGSVEALPSDRRFDAIAMLDLLEHIPDPTAFLRAVRARLTPGGRLLIMVPNIRSFLARVSGRRWVSFKIPEHVVYYSRRSIHLMLTRAGLRTTAIRPAYQHVTVAFALDRLSRLAPTMSAYVQAPLRALGLDQQVVPVTNGSIDVLATVQADSERR